MTGELDLRRLSELQRELGAELPEIVATLVAELQEAVAAIDAGLRVGDLPAVGLAAHAARNSALMIDARPMLAELDALESASRACDRATAETARDRLDRDWAALRGRLQAALQ